MKEKIRGCFACVGAFIMIHILFICSGIQFTGFTLAIEDYNHLYTGGVVVSIIIALSFCLVSGRLGYKRRLWFLGTLTLLAIESILFPKVAAMYLAMPFHAIMAATGYMDGWAMYAVEMVVIVILILPAMAYGLGRTISNIRNKA